MKERPILFSGPMVKAIIEGRKAQTRRLNGLEKINRNPDSHAVAHPDGGGPICLIGYGQDEIEKLETSGIPGKVIVLRRQPQ